MFTIIGGDGNEYGPVPASQVRAWIAGGRANLQTKAKKIGEDVWKPLGDFPEFSPAAAASPLPLESTPPAISAAPLDEKKPAADVPAPMDELQVGACLSRGWDLWLKHLWRFVPVYLVLIAISVPLGLIAVHRVPVASLLFNGVFTAGLFRYALKLLHGEKAGVSDLFAGFSKAFGPLVLASLFVSLLTMLGFICLILPGIYLAVAWTFTYPLILEKKLAFWPAMEMSRRVISQNWWRMFLLMFAGGMLSMLGIVALFIGIILTLPIGICVLACAYDTLCNPAK